MMMKGIIEDRGKDYIMLVHEGIGYKIILPEAEVFDKTGEQKFYLHEVIRDDVPTLFGFLSLQALELFWKLISVSGVGAKSAQKIVYTGKIEDVRASLLRGDLEFLLMIPGIGKKTAQKIILELKGVLAQEPAVASLDGEALEALIGLGYTRRQVEEVLAMVEAETTEERVKMVLRMLGNKH